MLKKRYSVNDLGFIFCNLDDDVLIIKDFRIPIILSNVSLFS